MKKKLIAIHLLNDHSGSPLVFRQALEALQQEYLITLYTATPSGQGFLSDIPGVCIRPLHYHRCPDRWRTLFYFLYSQILLFRLLLVTLRNNDLVYINTLLPFGAALAAKIRGNTLVYHVHETSLKPALLKSLLCMIMRLTANQVLFVSHYVAAQYPMVRAKATVIYNSLPVHFTEAAKQIAPINLKRPFTVTMLSSLKAYKGIYEFVAIARMLPRLKFELVLNASAPDTDAFRRAAQPPANCFLFAAQHNTIPFYDRAHVVLNLSRPGGWVETFGMTLLEAMHCGRPVICPATGGVLELVTDGKEGYTVDSADKERISALLERLSADFSLYRAHSAAALKRATDFSARAFIHKICEVFKTLPDSARRKMPGAVFREMEKTNG